MSSEENKIAEVIASRRTIHNFKPAPIPDIEIIKQGITLASRAPNHHLTEPWHFYLLQHETIHAICELNLKLITASKGAEAAEAKITRWRSIPGWIVVTCRKSSDPILAQEDYAACSCAIQNLMLYLWEQGIGSKWSTGPVTRNDEFYDLVWVNEEIDKVIGIVWYGYPVEIPQTIRKPLQQIMTELP